MADKHHSGRLVKKKQKELEKKQKESLGLPENCDLENANVAIRFPEKVEETITETIKQNGRIEAQEAALDKHSKENKVYEKMKDNNGVYLKKETRNNDGDVIK